MGNDYTITEDGKYDIYFRPKYDGNADWHEKVLYAAAQTVEVPTEEETVAPATEPATQPSTDVPAPQTSDYFLVGSMNDWAALDEYKLTKNTAAETEEYMITVDLTADSQFKVVYSKGIQVTWFPDGTGNNYGQNGEITVPGKYTIYFRPNYDGTEDWFSGCIYAYLEAEAPTEAVPTEPETQPETQPATTAGEVILGDVDGDGEVTVFDATYIQRFAVNMSVTNFNEAAGDVDGDGEVTAFDATYILRYAAGMKVSYPIGEPM